MDILAGIILVGLGISLLLAGFRMARIIIPLWGFIAGLAIGGAIISDLSEAPFLGTALGILVGLFTGILLAVLSYAYYAFAIIILIASTGYVIGSEFIQLLGFSPGVLSAVVGVVLGAIFGLVAVLLNAPRVTLILFSSVAGAVVLVGGILLVFNQIPLEAFSYAAAREAISNSWFWSLIAVALSFAGMGLQAVTTMDYEVVKWGYDDSDVANPTHTTTPHAPTTT